MSILKCLKFSCLIIDKIIPMCIIIDLKKLKGERIMEKSKRQIGIVGTGMIAVLVVDDHPVILKSLQYLIGMSDDIQVIATAASGEEAVAHVGLHCPDVIVMDISMPQMNGIEATRQILVQCPLTRVIMLSSYDTSVYIRRSLEGGATGYVLKDKMGDELLDGIRAVFRGSYYFSQKIAKMAENFLP
jgi:DNA-binding NarL/FixJ family response regulator